MSHGPAPLVHPTEADPFELPTWLGETDVVWVAAGPTRESARVHGALTDERDRSVATVACDLVAVDHAYPRALLDEGWRGRAHQAWSHGEVLLLDEGGTLVLAVPGAEFTADLVLESLRRLAKAVGVQADRFRATLRP